MKYAILISFFMVAAFAGKAQYGFVYTTSGNIDIYSVQGLTFTGGTATTYFNNLNDYQNGKIVLNYGTLAVKSNVNWLISISASGAYFTPTTQGGSTNMPANVMSFKLSTSSTYIALSTTSQTLKTGTRGLASASGNTFTIDQKFNPGFSYKGGIYTMGVVYTLTQQ